MPQSKGSTSVRKPTHLSAPSEAQLSLTNGAEIPSSLPAGTLPASAPPMQVPTPVVAALPPVNSLEGKRFVMQISEIRLFLCGPVKSYCFCFFRSHSAL